jgi:hypothetical protein
MANKASSYLSDLLKGFVQTPISREANLLLLQTVTLTAFNWTYIICVFVDNIQAIKLLMFRSYKVLDKIYVITI